MRCCLLVLLSCSGAASLLLPRPVLRTQIAHRSRAVRAGFEVEDLSAKDVEEMNVLNWPGLEKRSEDFEKVAFPDELVYVYCREGGATLSADGEETVTIAAGQLVIVNDGAVRWTEIAEGGVTLITTTSSTDPDAPEPGAPEEVKDLTLKEGAILLGAGLASGALISVRFPSTPPPPLAPAPYSAPCAPHRAGGPEALQWRPRRVRREAHLRRSCRVCVVVCKVPRFSLARLGRAFVPGITGARTAARVPREYRLKYRRLELQPTRPTAFTAFCAFPARIRAGYTALPMTAA